MCQGCWEKYDKPAIVNERTLEGARLIDGVYYYSCVGGNAHVVVDDFNIEDCHIEACLTDGLDENIHEADADQLAAERACLEYLRGLSIEERASALALFDGYVPGYEARNG